MTRKSGSIKHAAQIFRSSAEVVVILPAERFMSDSLNGFFFLGTVNAI